MQTKSHLANNFFSTDHPINRSSGAQIFGSARLEDTHKQVSNSFDVTLDVHTQQFTETVQGSYRKLVSYANIQPKREI